MINYDGSFVAEMRQLRAQLDALLKKNVPLKWNEECEAAFNRAKIVLASDLLLTHFDLSLNIIAAADASDHGIGAVILRRMPDGTEKAIWHASRSLTAAERNYGQIEKEGLALIFATEDIVVAKTEQDILAVQSAAVKALTVTRKTIEKESREDEKMAKRKSCQRTFFGRVFFSSFLSGNTGPDANLNLKDQIDCTFKQNFCFQAMRLTLTLLALVGCTMAGVYKTQVLKVESPRLRMMREGTWTKFVEERNAIRIAMGNVVPQAVNDFTDVQYLGNVTLGTPEQAFTVVLDTGSANLWIPDSSCNNLACKNKRKFKASESSTYKKNGHPWSIQYGTGAAQGILGEETVRFGDQGTEQLVVPECGFGQASHLAPFFTHVS
ncbi:eukaryotic aspartyl protease [Necator americanus]|uniref:Eukaryotic aspartyl protease n=1 Tax=Necator americanus TaxID=51031 RepID=W2TW43_NECAM|nr:eukaryotic aspartyl protease [Necator americanus]ETN85271.1 eukaryotic aspartyl protease [Necator americanus]